MDNRTIQKIYNRLKAMVEGWEGWENFQVLWCNNRVDVIYSIGDHKYMLAMVEVSEVDIRFETTFNIWAYNRGDVDMTIAEVCDDLYMIHQFLVKVSRSFKFINDMSPLHMVVKRCNHMPQHPKGIHLNIMYGSHKIAALVYDKHPKYFVYGFGKEYIYDRGQEHDLTSYNAYMVATICNRLSQQQEA